MREKISRFGCVCETTTGWTSCRHILLSRRVTWDRFFYIYIIFSTFFFFNKSFDLFIFIFFPRMSAAVKAFRGGFGFGLSFCKFSLSPLYLSPCPFEPLETLDQPALGSSSNQWTTRVPLFSTRVHGKRWKLTQPLAPDVSCLHMGSGFLTEISIIYSPRAYLISLVYTRPTFQKLLKSVRHCISCLIFLRHFFLSTFWIRITCALSNRGYFTIPYS